MSTISVPGSIVETLNNAAAEATTKSYRGKLATRLANASVRSVGSGTSHVIDVPDGLVKEFRAWLEDARAFAKSEREREALRRLRKNAAELASA